MIDTEDGNQIEVLESSCKRKRCCVSGGGEEEEEEEEYKVNKACAVAATGAKTSPSYILFPIGIPIEF